MQEQMSQLSKGDGVTNQSSKCLTFYKQPRETQPNAHSLMHGLVLMYNIYMVIIFIVKINMFTSSVNLHKSFFFFCT